MDSSEFTIKLLDKLCELVKNCQNKEDVLEVIDTKVSSPIIQSNKDVSNTESPSTSFNTEASNSKNEIENSKNEIEKLKNEIENSNKTLCETEQKDKKRILELENIEKDLNNNITFLNDLLKEMSGKNSELEKEKSQLIKENNQLKTDKENLEVRFRGKESDLEVITKEKRELEERNTKLKQNFEDTSDQLRSIQEKYSSIKDDDREILVNLSNVVAQCSDNLSKQGIRIDSILGIISYFGQISNLKNNWNDYVTGAAKDLSLVTDTENNFFEILSQIYNKANPDEVLQLSLIMPEQNSRYEAQTHARPNGQTGKFVKRTIIPGVRTQKNTYVNPLVEIGD